MIGVYHDGTTQLGEAFAILIRWVDALMRVQTRVIEVTWYEFSLNNENVTASLTSCIVTLFG